MRGVKSATINDWSAIAWSKQDGVVKAAQRDDLMIFDRVGGGDSFASGLVYGLMSGADLETAVNYGAAWRAGDDYPGRHLDGHHGGGQEVSRRRVGPRRPLTRSDATAPHLRG